MKTLATLAVAAVILGASLPASADGVLTANYGGQITETADGWRIEFAVRDGGIRAWVRDHGDKPVAASGKATLLVAGKKLDVPLKADGEMLAADAGVASADKVAAILSLTVNGKPISARFGQEALVVPQLSAQAGAGKAAFEQACAACHGAALRGSDAGPPLLHAFYSPGSGHGDDVILAAAANGAKAHHWKFGDMPKPEGLKPGQEKDVLAYIRAMQTANGLGGAAAMPASMPMDHSGHMKH
ncbi:cytochrome c [Magnetospirillum sp. SS-4]|uniref:cytochrome c n=1 Tax=Magnetospirillum sp. SS-4 TaxID=2681465 RepID=UPI001572557F|nr:cytochrome c [Magnetospirillum sp. SS-4]